jgi:hypothetical protein
VIWHVSPRQPDLTSSIVEVTFNHCQRALLSYMVIKLLPLRESSTLIWALHWVLATHRPVVVNDIVIRRFILIAVFTTEGTFVTELLLMVKNFLSYNDVRTIAALNFSKLTTL